MLTICPDTRLVVTDQRRNRDVRVRGMDSSVLCTSSGSRSVTRRGDREFVRSTTRAERLLKSRTIDFSLDLLRSTSYSIR